MPWLGLLLIELFPLHLHEVHDTFHNACLIVLKTLLQSRHGTQNTLRRPGTPGVAKLVYVSNTNSIISEEIPRKSDDHAKGKFLSPGHKFYVLSQDDILVLVESQVYRIANLLLQIVALEYQTIAEARRT